MSGGPPARALTDRLAILPLDGPCVLVNAVAPDSLSLRDDLDDALDTLGSPWSPNGPAGVEAHPRREAPSGTSAVLT